VDVWGFERDNNADKAVGNPAIDSNPVDVLAQHGRLIIADAGGNTLLKAGRDGGVDVLSVFGNRQVKDPSGKEVPMQAVPTGLAQGPDGDYFMSQLTGFPFPVGGADVFRVDPDSGDSSVFASGFTNIMDLAFGRDGTLYVLEIDHDSLLGPLTDGALFAISRRGERRRITLPAGNLPYPGGLTVGDDALYVTINARSPGGGQVLRIRTR
jgi:hypothetical protein